MRRRVIVASLLAAALAGSGCGSSTKSSGKASADLSGGGSTIPIVAGGSASTAAASATTSAGGAATTAAAAGAATTAGGSRAAVPNDRAYPPASAAASGGAARPTIPAMPPYAPPSEPYPIAGPATRTVDDNRSTFALDVDTASYTLTRNYLDNGLLPDPSAVRTEEFVNFFVAGFPDATERGLTIRADGSRVPFLASNHRVLRVGVQGQNVPAGDRKPANLTFVIDTSGSMGEGNKLELVKSGLHRLVRSLGEQDTVEIVTFSSGARVVLERTHASDSGEQRIDRVIDELVPDASTNVQAGLDLGYRDARAAFRRGAINRVVLATDGIANVGATSADSLLASVGEEAGKGIQMAAIGVGFGNYNDTLLEQLADKGDGFYAYVDQVAEAERLFAERLTSTLQTVALDGKAEVRFNPSVVRSYRLLGYDDRAIPDGSLQDPTVGGGETGAGHVTTALYDIELNDPEVRGSDVVATAMVHWTDPDITTGRDRSRDITVDDVSRSFDGAAPRLRLAVWTAAFAERLRGGPWAGYVGLGRVRDGVDQVARDLDGDDDVAELGRLVSTAAGLRD